MFRKIEDFEYEFGFLIDGTKKVLTAIPDSKKGQAVNDDHRDLGRMAWHIVTTIPEMMSRIGLKFDGPTEKDPIPGSMKELLSAYETYSGSLLDQVKSGWNEETLQQEDEMYGMTWKRGLTLKVLINHEIHHRGQMTVLMRQAGLKVPGLFGPSKEEWTENGMAVPEL